MSCNKYTFHRTDGSEIKNIDRDDYSDVNEVCCERCTVDHSGLHDIMGLDSDFFNGSYQQKLEEDGLIIKIDNCESKSLDQLEAIKLQLLQCPLRNSEWNVKCNKIFNKDTLCNLLTGDVKKAFLEYYEKIEKCIENKQLSNLKASVLKSQDVIENEALYNYYGFLNKLLKVRDSDISKYSDGMCPKKFIQLGIHPFTLQYLELAEGCQYLSQLAIDFDNETIGKDLFSAPSVHTHAMNEVCIKCGRACRNHIHLPIGGLRTDCWDKDFKDGIEVWKNLKTGKTKLKLDQGDKLFSSMSKPDCGGRQEMIARTWAIYTIFKQAANTNNVIDLHNKDNNQDVKIKTTEFAELIADNKIILDYIGRRILPPNQPPYNLKKTAYMTSSYMGGSKQYLMEMTDTIEEINEKLLMLEHKIREIRGMGKKKKKRINTKKKKKRNSKNLRISRISKYSKNTRYSKKRKNKIINKKSKKTNKKKIRRNLKKLIRRS